MRCECVGGCRVVWVRQGLKSGSLENRPPAQPECWWPMGRRTQSGEGGKEKKTRSVLVRWPPLHRDTGGPLPMPCAWADDAEPSCLADRPVGGDGGMENKSPALLLSAVLCRSQSALQHTQSPSLAGLCQLATGKLQHGLSAQSLTGGGAGGHWPQDLVKAEQLPGASEPGEASGRRGECAGQGAEPVRPECGRPHVL